MIFDTVVDNLDLIPFLAQGNHAYFKHILYSIYIFTKLVIGYSLLMACLSHRTHNYKPRID
jgi:hypothetical protein